MVRVRVRIRLRVRYATPPRSTTWSVAAATPRRRRVPAIVYLQDGVLTMALLTMALLTPPRTCRKRRYSLRTVHHGVLSIALLTMASLQVALQDRVQLAKGAHLHSEYSHSKYSHSKYGHSKYGNRSTTVVSK